MPAEATGADRAATRPVGSHSDPRTSAASAGCASGPQTGGATAHTRATADSRPLPGPVHELWLVARLDLAEALRARWFWLYTAMLGGFVALLYVFALTESRVLGFMGLSRLLVTYVQVCMAIVPVFVLVTTVRSVAGDREAGVFEYLLALPVRLGAWFWGRLLARFVIVFVPVVGAMAAAAGWGWLQAIPVPWSLFGTYAAMLLALCWCFLGIGMLISSLARSLDVAQGAAFGVWLVLVLFLDLVLLGLLIEERMAAETAVAIAIANPLQVFRTAAMLLFDPDLVLLGPSAFVILDAFGSKGYLAWSVGYPLAIGTLCAVIGDRRFRRGDLP